MILSCPNSDVFTFRGCDSARRVRASCGPRCASPVCVSCGERGYRRSVEAARLKGLGVRAGVPDLIAIHRGQVYAIELKPEGGRATDTLLQAIDDIRAAGGHARICRGLDHALAVLESWGLLRGRTT